MCLAENSSDFFLHYSFSRAGVATAFIIETPTAVPALSPRTSASSDRGFRLLGSHLVDGPHLMDGKCLITTSRAWIVSKGTLGSRPESASCNACKLTQDTHLMDTLKMRSFPSPGNVTSSSTWEGIQSTVTHASLLRSYREVKGGGSASRTPRLGKFSQSFIQAWGGGTLSPSSSSQ